MTTLENWMVLSNTEPMIRSMILSQLRKWWTEPTGMEVHETGSYMTHTQDKLGWNQALEGVLTSQWRNQQVQFWQRIKSQQSAKQWMAELIKKLWNVAWDMWLHRNSALHKTEMGRLLIVEGDLNK